MPIKLYSVLTATVVLAGVNAFADSAATILGDSTGALVTYNNTSGAYPVIESILSQPSTVDGYTYTSYSMIAADSTGSLLLFGALPSGSTYVPAVGDAISVSGTYSPFHQIPEIGTLTAISKLSSGNSLAPVVTYTIPQLTASGTGTLPAVFAAHMVELDNVSLYTDSAATIPVTGNFATHANVTLYTKDASGNIMEIFEWASSYSVAGAFGGTPLPTGLTDIIGFVSQNGSFGPELTPTEFVPPVPEPSTFAICGVGALVAAVIRFRKNA